jgi:O-acetyl-ADP-ribose deacetylase (regulator of RNase III)
MLESTRPSTKAARSGLEERAVAVDASEHITIQISTDPWEQVEVDAFVCPTNSTGVMSEYPASKLRELAGRHVQAQVQQHTPLAVGSAFVTDAGAMRAKHLIHVPNTDAPGGRVQVEDILRAAAAVIVACKLKGFSSVAVPLMGAFDSGIPAEEAARAIHSEFRSYRGDRPLRVLLMAKDADEVEVFEMAIEGTG